MVQCVRHFRSLCIVLNNGTLKKLPMVATNAEALRISSRQTAQCVVYKTRLKLVWVWTMVYIASHRPTLPVISKLPMVGPE